MITNKTYYGSMDFKPGLIYWGRTFSTYLKELRDYAENLAAAQLAVIELLDELKEEFQEDDIIYDITDVWPDYVDWQGIIPDGDDFGDG